MTPYSLVFVMSKANHLGRQFIFSREGLRLGPLPAVRLCQFPHPCTVLGSLDRALVCVQKPGPSRQPHAPPASRTRLGTSRKYINAVDQMYQIRMVFLTQGLERASE